MFDIRHTRHTRRTRHIRRRTTLAALATALTLSACSSSERALGPAPDAPAADQAAPTRAAATFEIKFLENMIDHHHMAVMMAEVCVQKAHRSELIHTELRDLCADIAESQSAEMRLMQRWLRDWYGISYQPQMKPGDERMVEKLAALDGAEFEIEFMRMMIKHHEKAIKEAEQCVRRAYHAQLRGLCENIIEAQTAEIELMRTWLCQWYGICK